MMRVTQEFLSSRVDRARAKGFGKQRWIVFCETMMREGYKISMYEAQKTVSKYITVYGNGREFKVRFSNHRPIYHREIMGACDFFVGHTHTGVRTTRQAIEATVAHLEGVRLSEDPVKQNEKYMADKFEVLA